MSTGFRSFCFWLSWAVTAVNAFMLSFIAPITALRPLAPIFIYSGLLGLVGAWINWKLAEKEKGRH